MKTPKYTPKNTFEQQINASKQGWVVNTVKNKANKTSNKENKNDR